MQLLPKILSLLLLLLATSPLALCVSCQVAGPHVPTAAEMAFLQSDYDRAIGLYNEGLVQKPNDPGLVAGLVKVLLRQQKVEEAGALVKKAMVANPSSPVLETALGFVQYRAGRPWLASESAARATRLDPCNA